jgi:hypothetical protein
VYGAPRLLVEASSGALLLSGVDKDGAPLFDRAMRQAH